MIESSGFLLPQQITWYQKVGENERGKPVYGLPNVINARYESYIGVLRKSTGEEFTTRGRIFCTAPIQAGDKFNDGTMDFFAQIVRGFPNGVGEIVYWEAYF